MVRGEGEDWGRGEGSPAVVGNLLALHQRVAQVRGRRRRLGRPRRLQSRRHVIVDGGGICGGLLQVLSAVGSR